MPILQNAKKALRVSRRKTVVNTRVKSMMKTMMDKVKKSPTGENLAAAYSAIDTAVKNNLVHKNRAARLKGQLGKLTKPVVAEKKTAPKKTAAKKTTKKAAPKKKKAAAKKTAKK